MIRRKEVDEDDKKKGGHEKETRLKESQPTCRRPPALCLPVSTRGSQRLAN